MKRKPSWNFASLTLIAALVGLFANDAKSEELKNCKVDTLDGGSISSVTCGQETIPMQRHFTFGLGKENAVHTAYALNPATREVITALSSPYETEVTKSTCERIVGNFNGWANNPDVAKAIVDSIETGPLVKGLPEIYAANSAKAWKKTNNDASNACGNTLGLQLATTLDLSR